MTIAPWTATRLRRVLTVRGTVQGVGFRPTVYRLAVEQGLTGFVRNDSDGVVIEIEGDARAVASFDGLLRRNAPAAARIEAIHTREASVTGGGGFHVAASGDTTELARLSIPADLATCDECLRELLEPSDRRYLYPFITCTNCGPRFTIVESVPYDRARTTMSRFRMCAECQAEYDDPADRRFHSETNSCARCGPRLSLVPADLRHAPGSGRSEESSASAEGAEPRGIADAVARLRTGQIVAIKGLGGFHFAVDALNENAVARLRARKSRPDKPFAVMVRDLATAERFADIDETERLALLDPARPIVCLRKRLDVAPAVAPSVAPRLNEIGMMLPYTPLHHLLLKDGPAVLVMTSGNRVDEPVAIDDTEAFRALSGIADAFLLHDRPIQARADDSVVRVIASEVQPLRRSRGMVPESVPVPFASAPVLAVGAELKNTVCVVAGERASLSTHIGDLSHPDAAAFFEQSIARMVGGSEPPQVVAHDLHPDYRSTRWALQCGIPAAGVQHHHAHVASCLVDNGRTGPVIGIAFDGTGCGPAGELWGGEILLCDFDSFTRAGHLRAILLPGGEAAIREPWRLAAAALLDAGEPLDILERIGDARLRSIRQLIERGVRSPAATSAGRWFDAVAALCAVCGRTTYEGQAAMELESIAAPAGEAYPFVVTDAGEIDLRLMVRAIAADVRDGIAAMHIAARFHETLVAAVAELCERLPLRVVALSGGCFQNRRLTERMKETLESRGFEILLHRRVPANDGGIALGQAAIAASRMRGLVN